MAKLRRWCAYRKIERPYTRYSNRRKKAFVKARPGKKVIKFEMGDLGKSNDFDMKIALITKDAAQIRANAIEAGRIAALRKLETALGRTGFNMRIEIIPHHVIRENPLAAGAGADRLSTGMKHSFGKVIATAARVEEGKVLVTVSVPKNHANLAREALKGFSKKLPVRTTIQ